MGGRNCKGYRIKNPKPERKAVANPGTPSKYDYIEGVVCNSDDIEEDEMKVFPLGEDGGKVLLVKQKGQIHALGPKCTHFGALLHTGALGDGRIRCPWHGACFNVTTGDIEDFPGLDSLPCHQVTISESGLVTVKAKRRDLESNRRVKDMSPYDETNTKTVLIIGGGPAGATCAQTLREEGFTGKIVMISMEEYLPYDRTKVSKNMGFEIEKALLRPQLFYTDNNIETKLNVSAKGLDTVDQYVELNNGEVLNYDHLFIATGSRARLPDLPGIDLDNIFVLREYIDANDISLLLAPDVHVVILGLSFIALEAASYCIDKCASVTVIGRDSVPFRSVFGYEIGNRMRQEFESKGVKFFFNSAIEQFIPSEADDIALGQVELPDGTLLKADIAIIAVGSTYYTDWVKESLISMQDNGTIIVDEYLRTTENNVYAGGDIAYAPILGSKDICAAIGHYSLAHYHGRIAALNICGKQTALNTVPFFWTSLLGKSYRYAGYGKPDEIRIYGSLQNLEFFAFYLKDKKIIAMSSVGADPIVAEFANALYAGKSLTEQDIARDPFDWIQNKPKELLKKFPRDSRTYSLSK